MIGLRKHHLTPDTPRAMILLSAFAVLIAAPALPQTPGGTEPQDPIPILEYGDGNEPTTEAEAASDAPSADADPASPARSANPALSDTDTASIAPVTGPDIRAALSGEMAQMRRDIADIARFKRWQDDLARIARTDPDEALRQRLPMADCLASLLAPICDDLTGLFRPEDAE